jgi:hypothetical protein
MALTVTSAPRAAITPATMKNSPMLFMAKAGHTRSPTTLRSVRPGPGNWVCFCRHTMARWAPTRATMRAGMSRMCTG